MQDTSQMEREKATNSEHIRQPVLRGGRSIKCSFRLSLLSGSSVEKLRTLREMLAHGPAMQQLASVASQPGSEKQLDDSHLLVELKVPKKTAYDEPHIPRFQ